MTRSLDEEGAIPFVDLATQSRAIKDEVLQRIGSVIDRSDYILGRDVAQFEQEFAEFCGVEHCVGLANGTDAIHLALRAMGIGPGDEVITAANSFAATAFAIAYTGATPVLWMSMPATSTLMSVCLSQRLQKTRERSCRCTFMVNRRVWGKSSGSHPAMASR